jgi:hypothetical protein
MESTKIELSINTCFKTFDQSFNRMRYFSCIASHLDFNDLPFSWNIHNPNGFAYGIKSPETQEEKQNILYGYKHFIHCYLLRDCIESFAISMDYLFLMLSLNGKKVLATQTLLESLCENGQKEFKKFENAGLSKKVENLQKRFQLDLRDDNKEVIKGLNDIRNCFAHSNGIVRDRDGKNDGQKRKFTWKTIFIFAKGEVSGNEFPIPWNEPMPEQGMICLQIRNHEKSFEIGQQLSFTPSEVHEIAFSLQRIGINFIEEIQQKLTI